jgi:hypothetical protein
MSGDTRLWMYRKGEARLFGHPDDVPEGDGWQRFPLPPEADEEQQPGLSRPEKLDCMSRQRLMQVASDCGVRFETSCTKAQLIQAILEAMNDNRA